MGVLHPFCIATDGVYAYAISFAFDNSHDESFEGASWIISPQYAILAQSNAYPDFSTFKNINQQDIEKALTWKSTHIIPQDVADSWFKGEYQARSTQEYSCGAVNFGGPSSKENFTFTLHITDAPYPGLEFAGRRLTTVKFGPNGKHEIIQDVRGATVPVGGVAPMNATLAGAASIRSPLIPLNDSDVNTPWVEAMAANSPGVVQVTSSVNGAFPAIVQEERALPYPPAALAFGPQKLHILGVHNDCVQLVTSNTRVENKTMILADDPASLPPRAVCLSSSSVNSTSWKIVEDNDVVYALGAKNSTQRSFDLIQFSPNTTADGGNVAFSSVDISGNQAQMDPSRFQDLLPLLPFKSGSSLTGFMAGNLDSTFILSPIPTGDIHIRTWKATQFNITIDEPYKYFSYRDPELLSKLQIGLIAGASCLVLIFIIASVRRFMQLKRHSREATERDVEGAGARTGEDADAEGVIAVKTGSNGQDEGVVEGKMSPPEYEMEVMGESSSSSSSTLPPPPTSVALEAADKKAV